MTKRFSPRLAKAIDAIGYMKIRAGDHRFIYVWVVVTDGRVTVRSWNDKPSGWYRAFRKDPDGAIEVDGKEVLVRAVPVRSAKLIAAADVAYAQKYRTTSNLKYVKGFATTKRQASTLELLPRSK